MNKSTNFAGQPVFRQLPMSLFLLKYYFQKLKKQCYCWPCENPEEKSGQVGQCFFKPGRIGSMNHRCNLKLSFSFLPVAEKKTITLVQFFNILLCTTCPVNGHLSGEVYNETGKGVKRCYENI